MGIVLKETSIIFNDNDAMERTKKEQEYLNYIIEHINFVIDSYKMYMLPLLDKTNITHLISDEEIKESILRVGDAIETHDASKFSDSEFDGYRAKYHPTTRELEGDDIYKGAVDERYQECWEHHYKINAHHPEHWLNHEDNTCRDMSLDAIIEMLCDWEAMSLKFGTSTLEWYKNDATDEKRCFSLKTKELVEELLFNVLHNTTESNS